MTTCYEIKQFLINMFGQDAFRIIRKYSLQPQLPFANELRFCTIMITSITETFPNQSLSIRPYHKIKCFKLPFRIWTVGIYGTLIENANQLECTFKKDPQLDVLMKDRYGW